MRKNSPIFVADIICSEKNSVFRERSSNVKTVSFEEQLMSKDKYPDMFSPQMEAIVLIIIQMFFFRNTCGFENIGEYHSDTPQF